MRAPRTRALIGGTIGSFPPQLYDAAELYRMWSSNLPGHATRPQVAHEHKAIFEAALARDADLAVDLMTEHLETTARHLEAVAPHADLPADAVAG